MNLALKLFEIFAVSLFLNVMDDITEIGLM